MSRIALPLRTFFALALPYFRSEERWRAGVLLAAIVVVELALVYLAVLVNEWNAGFFNAIQDRNFTAFIRALGSFAILAAGMVVVTMGQYYFGQSLIIGWRRFMTERYVSLWMRDGRHYKMRFVAENVDNIHLRIANDVYLFVQRTHELATNLLGSIVALLSFIVILWGLSALAPLTAMGLPFDIPGYLVWAALLYAGLGTLITHWIGRPLIPLNFNQQRYESDFRFAIARVTDHSEPVALMRGEPIEREELGRRFGALVTNWRNLVQRQAKLTGIITGYSQISTVFPLIIVSPGFLFGKMTLGTMMQAALAFQKVESAFAFVVSAYAKIAEWKAIIDRLAQFEAAMLALARANDELGALRTGAANKLAVSNLVLRLPSGIAVAKLAAMTLEPGERGLITGASGSGKSSLFRALAGLWPIGEGQISLPAHVLALPQRTYFPLGSLRTALAYPAPCTAFDEGELHAVMVAVELDHLTPQLDVEADWASMLSAGEQQRVALARALLAKPDVLLLDEAVATLDDLSARALYRRLIERLPDTILVSIGRRALLDDLHDTIVEVKPAIETRPKPVPVPPTAAQA